MKPRDYCCCAIPTVNAGIYATLIEQFVVGVTVGALSVGTPSIVGAATPSFAPWVLGILCFVVAGVQVLGFIGVSREKPTLYRRYVTIHGLATAATFAVAATWAVISAVKHNDAQERCIDDFFNGDGSESQGDMLCNIFPWVDVGIMGALWVILFIFHIYLFVIISSYGTGQRQDHEDYDRLYDSTQPLTKDNIPLADRSTENWEAKEDNFTTGYPRNYKHVRQNSSMSATDVLSQPQQQASDRYPDYETDYNTGYQPYSDNNIPQPSYAYTQNPAPTPYDGSYAGQQDYGHVSRPSRAQAHPGESY